MKGNVIVALVVGAALGFVVGKATTKSSDDGKTPETAIPAPPSRAEAAKPAEAPPARPTEDPNAVYKMSLGDSPSWGSPSAKVTVVEGTDFQCPFCSRANATLKQIKSTYGDKDLRVVIKQNPLPFHPYAHLAAEAALAADEQGKYWALHDKLFDNNQALDRPNLEKYAQEVGLDMNRFRAVLDQQKFKERIEAEQRQLQSVGAGGTPAFFVNGRKIVGAQPFSAFKQIIDEEMKKAEAMIARGVPAKAIYDEIQKGASTSPVMLPSAPSPDAAAAKPEEPPAVQKIEVPSYSPFTGPKHAKVTIVEFSDFQCPFCSRGAQAIHEVISSYPKDVKVVFRHQPLPFHSNAMPAAKAAMAAAKQGKFFEMHDKLFANQNDLSPAKIEGYAQELKLNMAKLKADMESSEIADQIRKDSEYGTKVGANGTPTFFVNGRIFVGAKPFAELKSVIDQEIARADELMKSGVKLADIYDTITSTAPPPAPEKPHVALQAGNAPVIGSREAPVQVFVFSDFQCPFCSRAVGTVKQIEQTYGKKVAVYFKQYPLPFHDKAGLAAEAALAAHEQGKFWLMHDKLFENQSALDRPDLERYARELGLDMAKFKTALDSGKLKDQIKKDQEQGSSANVEGTPSFVVNGKLIVGAQPFDQFKTVIDEELSKVKK